MHRALAIIGGAIVAAIACAAIFFYSGIYNVAASSTHTSPVYHLLVQTMRHSIKRRAANINAPEIFDSARVQHGAALYREHCVKCHGAPGVAPDAEAFGMYPQPPNLVDIVRTWRTT